MHWQVYTMCAVVLVLPLSGVQLEFLRLWSNIGGGNTDPRDLKMKKQSSY